MAYKPGDYLVICDKCGFRRYASECLKEWNNNFVCADTCFDEKHPHFTDPKPLNESQKVPVHRPEQDDVFLSPGDVTPDDL